MNHDGLTDKIILFVIDADNTRGREILKDPQAVFNSLPSPSLITVRESEPRRNGEFYYARATEFSSRYTELRRDCRSALTKKAEKEALALGEDIPDRCKGYGGYHVIVGYTGNRLSANSHRTRLL